MNTFLFIVYFFSLIILPALAWLTLFLFFDKDEPEPKSLIAKTILFSIFAVIGAIFLEKWLDGWLFSSTEKRISGGGGVVAGNLFSVYILSFFIAGPLEEMMKGFVLRLAIFKNRNFNQIADGIVYGVALAIGFSVIENTFYFLDIFPTIYTRESSLAILIFRSFVTLLLHLGTTGLIGYYLAIAKFKKVHRGKMIFKGFFLASLLHAIFNTTVLFKNGEWICLVLVVGLLFFLVVKMKSAEAQKIYDGN